MTTFAELNLSPDLARALTEREYLNAMPVQAAVLDPKCAGRDLLVSSQTGSGKTIAFGVALAQTLVGDGGPRPPRGPRPAALVIVPTRELAAQVREELGWLLKHTGLRLASFTGGTSVSGDLVALKRGVDVGIGTPGRLVDLVRRERLALTDIAVLVLDEADEMLDLGFREDLELLLKAAPVERRTLLLSATLPPEIRAMAKKFQRDALAVDPRTEAGAAPQSKAHDDIAYVAHLVAGGDRLAAVINVLRASGAERAIVFCTTRDGVGELHRKLVARGFLATAISGDRAQAERDRALDQLRRGEARVLVATNVAARGLHLPDVDLIVHADLPLNAESLTHRSGRTGRAGRKGTAVLIATATERRKAERLLSMAHVRAVWTPPPSADVITQAACERLIEELTGDPAATAEAAAPPATAASEARLGDLVARLEAKLDAGELLRRLLAREVARLPVGEPLRQVPIPTAGNDSYGAGSRSAPSSGRRPSPSELSRGGVLFRVNLGADDKAEARWLLPLICRRGGVTNREVGAIRVGPRETLFEIAGPAAEDFALSAAEPDPRAPHVRVERAAANTRVPSRDRFQERPPGRPSRAPYPARPSYPTKTFDDGRPAASLTEMPGAPKAHAPVARADAKAPAEKTSERAKPEAKVVEKRADQVPAPKAAGEAPVSKGFGPPKRSGEGKEPPRVKARLDSHGVASEKRVDADAPTVSKAPPATKGFGPPRRFNEPNGSGPARAPVAGRPPYAATPPYAAKPPYATKAPFAAKPPYPAKAPYRAPASREARGDAKGFGPPRTFEARAPYQAKAPRDDGGFSPARKPLHARAPYPAKGPSEVKTFAPPKKLYDAKVPHLPKGRPHDLKPAPRPFKAKPKAP